MLFDVALRIEANTPQDAVDLVHSWTLSPGAALQSVITAPQAAPVFGEVADENGHLAPSMEASAPEHGPKTLGDDEPAEVRSENLSDDEARP